ncbi:Putative peptidase M43, pregnancy-associated plasma-A [Septoria linicola]|uniref:Peptidase M43, pregnancy-associated plasma-A n=1 Tax=Septoria linicola TaxID=215465 RepID=A0A9Q9AVZ1_9PEZI|nr:putative peptidase M43, pregnancy-associated plasma-A [Septoria linicola]USW52821.1 Putative peptidase M43, pregnancy-associated plasma-A [Septoria linicola]
MKFTSTILAVSAASLAAAQSNFTRCAVAPPAAAQVAALNDAARVGAANQEISRVMARTVPVYVHVVTTSAKQGRYTQTQINRQIAVMNEAYAGMGLTFVLRSTDFTVNNQWAAANIQTTAERNMKTALKKGSYGELDLYFTTDIPNQTLGWCYFPVANPSSSELILDGCVNLADSMPGGSAAPFNLGATATHEVGHWLGLFHVFQGGCSGAGDQVADTPPQRTFSSGCPVGADTCPGGGVDGIHNWMDYSDDSCLDRFTAGQTTRATALFDQLRAGR